MTTKFVVTNNTSGNLAHQQILVYLTPSTNQADWVYASWQSLNPGEGGSQSFILSQNINGQMMSTDQMSTTNSMPISPGYVSSLIDADDLQPTLQTPVLGSTVPPPTVTATQTGIINNTTTPAAAMLAQWAVNGNLTCQSIAPVSAGGTLSTFELDTKLFWAVGNYQSGFNYQYNQITPLTEYDVPSTANVINVDVTYTASDTFLFTFTVVS